MSTDTHLNPRNPADAWIAEFARDRSFADVGGLWGTVNEKVTVAAQAGATRLAMIDVTPLHTDLWQKFLEHCGARGISDVECREADISRVKVADDRNRFDVVHCSGVIYHAPDAISIVQGLRDLTREFLVLGTTVIPNRIQNACGQLIMEPGSELFVPAMNAAQKAVVAQHFRDVGAAPIMGIDTNVQWDFSDYAPWWWLFTRESVAATLQAAGLNILQIAEYWDGRVAYFLTSKADKTRL